MPFYNTPLELTGRALESVVAQDAPGTEVVIVNDGSRTEAAQGLEELVARFRDRIEITLVHQPNAGPGAARNRAVAGARHQILAQLDSDDRWLPGKLQSQLSFLRDSPSTWMVFGAMAVIDTEGRALKNRAGARRVEIFAQSPERQYLEFLDNNYVNNSTVCFRKEGFTALQGYDTTLPASEDTDLWLRACRRGLKICYIDQAAAVQVFHGGNLSLQDEKRRRAWLRMLDRELHDPPAFLAALQPKFVRPAQAQAWFRLGRYAAAFGDTKMAKEAFRNALRCKPSWKAAARWLTSLAGF